MDDKQLLQTAANLEVARGLTEDTPAAAYEVARAAFRRFEVGDADTPYRAVEMVIKDGHRYQQSLTEDEIRNLMGGLQLCNRAAMERAGKTGINMAWFDSHHNRQDVMACFRRVLDYAPGGKPAPTEFDDLPQAKDDAIASLLRKAYEMAALPDTLTQLGQPKMWLK